MNMNAGGLSVHDPILLQSGFRVQAALGEIIAQAAEGNFHYELDVFGFGCPFR